MIPIILITACDPNGLSDGTSLDPLDTGARCGAPLSTLGIRGGIACYSSYDIGSTATYSCLKCGLQHLEGSHVRTCLSDGNWNGSIPQCLCGK